MINIQFEYWKIILTASAFNMWKYLSFSLSSYICVTNGSLNFWLFSTIPKTIDLFSFYFSTNLGKLFKWNHRVTQGEVNIDERMEFINEVDLILDETMEMLLVGLL